MECPDLSQPPFCLASEGICGSPKLADVGGVPYLVPGPAAWRERVYSFDHVAQTLGLNNGLVLGACAGSKVTRFELLKTVFSVFSISFYF